MTNKQVFNSYVRYMRKAARAMNHCNDMWRQPRRHKRWIHEYFRYARIAINLAHQLPKEQRISFKVFVDYDLTGKLP